MCLCVGVCARTSTLCLFSFGESSVEEKSDNRGREFLFFFGKVFVASRSTSLSVLVIVGSVKEFCLTR